ncbi:MAG: Hsp70 family protein [Pseudomonadota bacterium]
MSKTIGIDLGTTNSAAGLKRLEVEIIPNAEGDALTPSVVGVQEKKGFFRKKEQFVVGKHALDWLAQDPENTILSVKRLMGRGFSDPDVERLIREHHFAYTIRPLTGGSANSVAVMLGDKEYAPEQISSMILGKIKEDCEKHLGEKIDYAVVTVPAYFNDKQKHATRIAAALAGLKVQRLLPEPTAAAISFGVDSIAAGEAKTILVYDFGGGTFDVSVLTVADGQFIEQGKGGDMWMGGDDIDSLIVRHVYRHTEEANGIEDITTLIGKMPRDERNRLLGDLKRKVEQAKIQLSDKERTVIEILGLLKDADGDILDIEVEFSREQFESLLAPFANRSVELITRVLTDIHFEPAMIDQVVMVGGSSSIPLLQRKVRELFGPDKVLIHPRPMLAITEGAAILAHRLADRLECPGCGKDVAQTDQVCAYCGFDLAADLSKRGVRDIVHSVSHDYYLELEDGSDQLLVEKNTPLPVTTQGTFSLIHAEQRLAHFKFFNRVGDARESIGDLWLSFDDTMVESTGKHPAEVTLDFKIDEDNIIRVAAALKGQPDIKVSRTLSRGGPDERLFLDLEQAIATINSEQHEYWVTYDFLQWATRIAKRINDVVDPKTGKGDTEIVEQTQQQLRTARDLAQRNETTYSQLYYAEDLVKQFGHLMPGNESKDLTHSIDALKAASETGTAEAVLKARKKMEKETGRQSKFSIFTSIDQAIEVQYKENPTQADRLIRQRQELFKLMEKNDVEQARKLLSKLMPEVHGIIEQYSKQKLHIWKGVRKVD